MIVGGFIFLSSDPRALDPSNDKIFEGITLFAPTTNSGTVMVGSSVSQIVPLSAGASLTIRHDKLTDIWVKDATNGDQILWYCGLECGCGCNCPKKVK